MPPAPESQLQLDEDQHDGAAAAPVVGGEVKRCWKASKGLVDSVDEVLFGKDTQEGRIHSLFLQTWNPIRYFGRRIGAQGYTQRLAGHTLSGWASDRAPACWSIKPGTSGASSLAPLLMCAGTSPASRCAAGRRRATRLAGRQLSVLWHDDIARLRESSMPRTIIGIVGDTGAGVRRGGQARPPHAPRASACMSPAQCKCMPARPISHSRSVMMCVICVMCVCVCGCAPCLVLHVLHRIVPYRAGKSTLLNALLGEEDILPTNNMRACTAAVVVLSYRPERVYHAEVDLMSREEWHSVIE